MTKTKEILLKMLQAQITYGQMLAAATEKDNAIKNQDFESALKWRNAENEARAKLPGVEQLKEWQLKLESSAD